MRGEVNRIVIEIVTNVSLVTRYRGVIAIGKLDRICRKCGLFVELTGFRNGVVRAFVSALH
jgi:hypothetical protein